MIYHETEHGVLYCGDCLDIMKTLPDNSVDAVVTDPPYGLGFMGKHWDTFDKNQFGIGGNEGENDLKVKKNFNILPRYNTDGLYDFTREWASECLRVLKPGGYLLSFAGTRTQHRIACGIEDAGFEIRDMIAWIYGSGFPKSLDVGKAIDKMQGTYKQGATSPNSRHSGESPSGCYGVGVQTKTMPNPQHPLAKHWDGFGTALKPALEPITVARKPIEGTVAANVLKWGTGAINIDGCRVGTKDTLSFGSRQLGDGVKYGKCTPTTEGIQNPQGRFPANLIHDGSDEVTELTGDAARFFYCAKASRAERNAGCEGLPERSGGSNAKGYTQDIANGLDRNRPTTNHHPTVKPIALMRYLIKLVTPPNGTVLDPFLGSGTTAIAAVLEGFDWIGIEREAEYCEIAARRIETKLDQTDIFREES